MKPPIFMDVQVTRELRRMGGNRVQPAILFDHGESMTVLLPLLGTRENTVRMDTDVMVLFLDHDGTAVAEHGGRAIELDQALRELE